MRSDRVYVKDVCDNVGKDVCLFGFVRGIRDQGGIKFLQLRDVTGLIQVVILKDSSVFKEIGNLTTESVVEIVGKAKEEKQAPDGLEVEAKSLSIISKAAAELPIPVVEEKSGGETDISKRYDWRWLDLRKPEYLKIFNIWDLAERGAREYFEENNYIHVHPPTLMSTSSESGADVFEVQYFEKKAYLAQSPQFYKQMAMAAGFEKVYMISPVFRAELSFTTRHVTEYTGMDFEISYIESHHDVMDELEKLILSMFSVVNKKYDVDIPDPGFPKITMEAVKKKLKAAGISGEKNYDINPEEERELCRIMKEETGSDFVFVTDYPVETRPFYHMRHEDDKKLTMSFDLLYKGVEVVTGSQREHRLDILEKQAREVDMPLDSLKDYFNFFRYGCPPHGGVGMGPSRIIMKMLDLPNVRDAIFLPRDVKRLTP